MITYSDLLDCFSKMAEDRFGAGGLLASDGEENLAQNTPSHDSKEKADLPDGKPSKLSFGGGKVVKGPEQQKINKNVFMTRGSDSTIKQAEEIFFGGFFKEAVLTDPKKISANPLLATMSAARRQKALPRVSSTPTGTGLEATGPKRFGPNLFKAEGLKARREKREQADPDYYFKGGAEAFMGGFFDELAAMGKK